MFQLVLLYWRICPVEKKKKQQQSIIPNKTNFNESWSKSVQKGNG